MEEDAADKNQSSIPVVSGSRHKLKKPIWNIILYYLIPLLVAIIAVSFWYFWMTDFVYFGSEIGKNRRIQQRLSDEEVVKLYGDQMDHCEDDHDCHYHLIQYFPLLFNYKCFNKRCIYRQKEL